MTTSEQFGEDSARLHEFQHFFDGVVHSLRASLRGIGTSAALLSRKWDERLDDEERNLLHSILDGVNNLNNLAKALAEYSMGLVRRKSPAMGPLPVQNALQTAIASLQAKIQESGADIHSGPLPRLEADHEQLGVLFRCLLKNALDYSNSEVAPRVEITATPEDDGWRFAVRDNGVGIAPRYQDQIFKPFERVHSGASSFGLGLAICKKIVAAHGGNLWVRSQEGEGTTFFFTLPTILPSDG